MSTGACPPRPPRPSSPATVSPLRRRPPGRGRVLYYADRAGDKITSPAGAVFPHLIEAALLRHPAVANCGVVGLGHPGSQTVVAAILLKPDHAPAQGLDDEILAQTADLPDHQRPTELVFVTDLPTVLGGAKVQRQALRDQLESRP